MAVDRQTVFSSLYTGAISPGFEEFDWINVEEENLITILEPGNGFISHRLLIGLILAMFLLDSCSSARLESRSSFSKELLSLSCVH